MEHRCRPDEEILNLVLHLRQLGKDISTFRVSSEELRALVQESPRAAWITRTYQNVRSCALCRYRFDTFWGYGDESDPGPNIMFPDVPPITQRDFRSPRSNAALPAGSAASDTPPGPVCEITCTAEDMLIRILAEPDGTATAVIFMTQGSPEGVVLRYDGNEAEFGASGVIQLPKMPVRIGVERRPPRPARS